MYYVYNTIQQTFVYNNYGLLYVFKSAPWLTPIIIILGQHFWIAL